MKSLNGSTYLIYLLISFTGCADPSVEDRPNSKTNPQVYTVEISQMKFSPAEITVKKGDKVTFINHDLFTHNVTEEFSKQWSSSSLQPNQSWTLEVTASANYYCSLHPVMKGKIKME